MADTIEIVQGTATTVEVAGPTGPQGPAGAAGATGATGATGPAGTGIETLTTKGDLLSRNDSAAIRVGIGSTGQVLKVSAQGLPAWANESGAVSSVAGRTGVVTLAVADVADAVATSDARLSDARTPSSTLAHASTHHTGGTDAIAPNQISAAWALAIASNLTISSDTTLTAGRNVQQGVQTYSATNINLTLPTSGTVSGDTLTIIAVSESTGDIVIRRQNHDGSGFGPQFTTLATATLSGSGERFTFRVGSGNWELLPVETHTHPASAISDSTTAGRALLTGADAAAQRTSLGLGTAATSATGDFAAASHSHGNINSSGQVGSTAGLPLVTTTAGAVTTLALGTANQVLRVNSGGTAVEFGAGFDAASPPAIGNTTAAAGTFTTLSANNGTLSSASAPVLDLSQTWNNAAVTFTAARINVTETGAGSSSSLFEFQRGGVTRCAIRRDGVLVADAIIATGGAQFRFLARVDGLYFQRDAILSWSNDTTAATPSVTNDLVIRRDDAGVFAQRNGTNPQESRLYGTFTSSTNYQRMTVKSVKQTLSALSGASATTTGTFIPDGAVVVGVTTRVATLLTGAAGYTIGDGTDADRWGDITGTAVGTTSDNRDWTAGTVECFTAGGNITLTAKTSNFTAGAIEICVFYLAGEAD